MEMQKLNKIDQSSARKVIYWLNKVKENEQFLLDTCKRQEFRDGEAQHFGRIRLLNYLIWEVENSIPSRGK